MKIYCDAFCEFELEIEKIKKGNHRSYQSAKQAIQYIEIKLKNFSNG
jgi:hypothetical protein